MNAAGYHLHFLTEDGTKGGYVLECALCEGMAAADLTAGFAMLLPQNEAVTEPRGEDTKMDPKEKKIKRLEIEDLADVRGGSFIPLPGCPDQGTSKCTENPYTCGTQDKNKNLCTFEALS
ncbi:acetolactate decarboxylase [Candidatus Formimonas warabiya]|uniref:Uncharacterized protein n=1 Tax=Formimonas warabiya TaxID=1761012 RepID=A0A3G1KM70_FORW1|nr:acetolactate decarboxylase [Candidatus Formimonas warabiya]ATW23517.1 hypothetical protein DCMF_00755 [Candidatus Formimonas warabiya]